MQKTMITRLIYRILNSFETHLQSTGLTIVNAASARIRSVQSKVLTLLYFTAIVIVANFLSYGLSSAIFHPHFIIRIFPSVFCHLHVFTRLLGRAFLPRQ